MTVQLTWHEQFLAAQVGLLRYFRAVRDRRLDGHGLSVSNGDGIALHINGAMGELAFAKSQQLYWDGSVDTFKSADVGAIHVRTRSRAGYELLIRDDDPDDAPFVLVRGDQGCYDVVGWIWSRDARRREWRQTYGDREAAFFVPDRYLLTLATLPINQGGSDARRDDRATTATAPGRTPTTAASAAGTATRSEYARPEKA